MSNLEIEKEIKRLERPELTSGKTPTHAILLLLDVVGYSSQLSKLGGAAGVLFDEMIQDVLAPRLSPFGLTYIKPIGDAALFWGTAPGGILEAARTLCKDNPIPNPQNGIVPQFRMLAHQGYVYPKVVNTKWEDVTGPDVVLLFRLEKAAQQNQLLVTPSLYTAVRDRLSELEFTATSTPQDPLKGVEDISPRTVYLLRPPLAYSVRMQAMPQAYRDAHQRLRKQVEKIPVFGNLAEAIPMAENFLNLRVDPAHTDTVRGFFRMDYRSLKDRYHTRPEDGRGAGGPQDRLEWDSEQRLCSHVPATRLFQVMPKAVIAGLPGAGKTTILRHFAYLALNADPDQFVVFAPLRLLTAQHAALLEQGRSGLFEMLALLFLFPDVPYDDLTEPQRADVATSAAKLREAWDEKKAILFFDALDEIPRAEDRIAVSEAFVELVESLTEPAEETDALRRHGAYVTTRVGELLAGTGNTLQKAPIFMVNSLDQSQLHKLVDRQLGAGTELAERCKNELVERADIRRIAGTPMTALLMIFFFEYYGRWALRFETYRIVVIYILFKVWARSKQEVRLGLRTFFQDVLKPEFLTKLPEVQLQLDCLAQLSRETLADPNPHSDARSPGTQPTHRASRALNEDALREQLLEFLMAARTGGAYAGNTGAEVVDQWLTHWREESVLLPSGAGEVTFVHSTVMEFLAAYDAAGLVDFEELDGEAFSELLSAHLSEAGESLEVLPILCSRSWETGHRVLNRMERQYDPVQVPAPVPPLALRCLTETELAEQDRLRRCNTGRQARELRNRIDDASSAGWVYERIAGWFRLPPERRAEAEAEIRRWRAAPGLPSSQCLTVIQPEWQRRPAPAWAMRLLEALLHPGVIEQIRWRAMEARHSPADLRAARAAETPEETRFLELVNRYRKRTYADRVRIELAGVRAARNGPGGRPDAAWNDLDLALVRSETPGDELSGPRRLLGSTRMRHGAPVFGADISPDGRFLVSGGMDGVVRLWDAESGAEIRSFLGHTERVSACTFSPDGSRILSTSSDQSLKLWDAGTGNEIRSFLGHTDGVSACAFSPNGFRILSASSDRSLKLWDAESGAEIRSFLGHTDGVSACAFSPDGSRILSASLDHSLKLWDTESSAEIYCFLGHTDGVRACKFSSDGAGILSCSNDHSLKLWQTESGNEIRCFLGHVGGVLACAFSPDGSRIVSASYDQSLKLWDAVSGAEIRSYLGHTKWVLACAFSPDGCHILSASFDHALRLWDAESGAETRSCVGHTEGVSACAFSPDGSRILSASYDHSVKLWDAESGAEIRSFLGHTRAVRTCCFSPDGSRILTASDDQSLKLWDAESGAEIRSFLGHTNGVWACAFSPDGSRIVTASWDSTLKLWDTESGAVIRPFLGHTNWVRACAFSPDGSRILSASADHSLKLWDAESGAEIRSFLGLTREVSACAFSPDGSRILSASDDQSLKLWDTESGAVIRSFLGHTNRVLACSFSPDGSRILSASWDQSLKLWDAESGALLGSVELGRPVISIAVHPDPAVKLAAAGLISGLIVLVDYTEVGTAEALPPTEAPRRVG